MMINRFFINFISLKNGLLDLLHFFNSHCCFAHHTTKLCILYEVVFCYHIVMKALIQRVKKAQVDIDGQTVGQINQGILALIGIEREDSVEKAERLLNKICRYRIFSDEAGKMNLSLNDIQGELLLVSQFTLVAETQKGNRPGFSRGATPEHGELIFNQLVKLANNTGLSIQTGQFGADMQVSLINDGPVTFWLETP